jgi:hypothetical protein
MEHTMSLFKKLVTVASTVALLASGLAFSAPTALAAAHGPGSVVKTSDGTVWFITSDNQRRAFTSAGAFLSYGFLSFSQVVDANADDNGLVAGSFIPPRDGAIFCATATKGTDVNGECALITGGMKASFVSAAVFAAQGHSFSRAQYGDSSFLAKTSNIDNGGAAHRQGVLVNQGGTVYLVGTATLLGIPSVDVFNSWGYSFADVVPANSGDMAMTKSGVMCARVAGQLNPSFSGTCGSTVPTPPGDLNGGVGDITVTAKSTYSSEEVGEGENDVPVMAFEVEAGDDSDVRLTSMKVELKQTNTADSQDITDYVDNVSIWMGDTKVGESDASDFTENSDIYTRSMSLSNAVIRAGETETFVVAVSALNSLDSGDINSDVFAVDVLNVRFEDGDGVFTTEDTDGNALDKGFDFATFATSADVELKAALNDADDDINLAHIIDVDDNADTNGVAILSFTLEAAGDSDITVHSLPVNVDVTGALNVDDMITNITLVHGSDEFNSTAFGSAVGADETYIFDDLEIDIGSGDKEEFQVEVDFKSTADVDLDNGDTISAQLSATEVDAIDAEDEAGDDVSTTNLTGTAVGEASAVYDTGIMAEFVSASETTTFSGDAAGEEDIAQFKINFKVTAFDGDMRIDKSCEDIAVNGIGDAGEGTVYTVTGDDNDAPACSLTSSTTDSEDNGNVFEVDEGTTRSFTLTVSVTGDDDASGDFISVAISSIGWGTATDNSNDNNYTFNLDEFKTDTLFVNSQ